MIRRLCLIVAAVATVLVTGSTGAWASESDQQYATVAWAMPAWDEAVNQGPVPTWPQHYVAHVVTSEPDLDALDGQLEGCGQWQVDVYKYSTPNQQRRVDALIAGGVLTGPNQPYREPLVSAKLVQGDVCASPSPSPSQPVEVTPIAPEPFNSCPDFGGVTVTLQEGVSWSVNGGGEVADEINQVSFGPGEWTAHVVATPRDGYTLVGQTEWTFTDVLKPCPTHSPKPTPTATPPPVPELPHTGFAGTGWFLGGFLTLLGGVLVALARRPS